MFTIKYFLDQILKSVFLQRSHIQKNAPQNRFVSRRVALYTLLLFMDVEH